MRLRIVHQLSLLMVGSVLLAVAAVGGLVAWNLQTGFTDYLRSRDAQQLERFAQVVAQRVTRDPSMAPGGGRGLPMRELMDEFLTREGLAPPANWRPPPDGRPPRAQRPPPPRREGPPPVAFGAGQPGGAPPPPAAPPEAPPEPPPDPPPAPAPEPPPRNAAPDSVTRRIQVVNLQGQRIGGPEFPEGRALLREPVQVDGRTVAYVRMLPSAGLEGVDARFLRRQYLGLALAAGGSLALALVAAWLAARWLGRPLGRVQAATRRIAGGELDVVVPESGSREMADLIADVNRMAASLKSLEGARRSWIAQISHELRTPLSVLLGELESIEDGARQPTPQVLANLRAEVLHLVRLVNDLHTLSMADLGALRCEFGDGDASEALARAVQRFVPRAQKAGLALELLAGPPVLAGWDFGRIEQLLTNLLENSLRYTTAPGRVRVQWVAERHTLELRVEDTPPGVKPQQLDQLFEPLFRADHARQRRLPADGDAPSAGSGSGLGLAICRAIVQAHGGRISAQASALGGLCIVVSLPLRPEHP
ncbi:MAG: HAMP domain-containing protein [Ramlibacter sp.]|nr:HAMP domain-containing protein [Ramlibacter sp.]